MAYIFQNSFTFYIYFLLNQSRNQIILLKSSFLVDEIKKEDSIIT